MKQFYIRLEAVGVFTDVNARRMFEEYNIECDSWDAAKQKANQLSDILAQKAKVLGELEEMKRPVVSQIEEGKATKLFQLKLPLPPNSFVCSGLGLQ